VGRALGDADETRLEDPRIHLRRQRPLPGGQLHGRGCAEARRRELGNRRNGGLTMIRRAAMAVAFGAALTVPLLAHHSAAPAYDIANKLTFHGTVTKVEW